MENNPSIRPLVMQAGHSNRGRGTSAELRRRGMTCSHRAGGDIPLRDHPMMSNPEFETSNLTGCSDKTPPALKGSMGGIPCQ